MRTQRDNVQSDSDLTLVITRCPDDIVAGGLAMPHYCVELRKPNPYYSERRANELADYLRRHPTEYKSSVRDEYARVAYKECTVMQLDPALDPATGRGRGSPERYTIRTMPDALAYVKNMATRLGGMNWKVDMGQATLIPTT